MKNKEVLRHLTPQKNLDLVLTANMIEDKIDVRQTVILDFEGKDKVIISQTSPPILRSMTGREIEATFIAFDREGGERKRFGFRTKILEHRPNYELRAGVFERAVVISYPQGELKESGVRLHFRINPASEHAIKVSLVGIDSRVNLIDISQGGLQISCGRGTPLQENQNITVVLFLKGRPLRLKGEVRRVFEIEGSRFLFAGIRFVDVESEVAQAIQELTNEIMRSELRARSGLDDKEESLATPQARE